MARSTRTWRLALPPAVASVTVAGFTIFLVIGALGVYLFEGGHVYSTWYFRLFHDHAADFAYVGLVTYGIVLVSSLTRKKRSRRELREFSLLALWFMASFVLLMGITFECYQYLEKPSHGDWRDMVAETLGWLCTVIAVTLAARRDRRREAAAVPKNNLSVTPTGTLASE